MFLGCRRWKLHPLLSLLLHYAVCDTIQHKLKWLCVLLIEKSNKISNPYLRGLVFLVLYDQSFQLSMQKLIMCVADFEVCHWLAQSDCGYLGVNFVKHSVMVLELNHPTFFYLTPKLCACSCYNVHVCTYSCWIGGFIWLLRHVAWNAWAVRTSCTHNVQVVGMTCMQHVLYTHTGACGIWLP